MKKFFYGIGFMLFATSVFAADFNGDVCDPNFTAPESCWEEVGTSVQKRTDNPNCDSLGNLNKTRQKSFFKSFGEYKTYLQGREEDTLSEASKTLIGWEIPTDTEVDTDSEATMKRLQTLIKDQYEGGSFANGAISCTYNDHGTDGFYGICTQYAFKKFLDLVPKDCTEPEKEQLIERPSNRCRIELRLSQDFYDLKLQKKEEAKKATEGTVVDASTELEKALTEKLGRDIKLLLSEGTTFYFEMKNSEASTFKEGVDEVLRSDELLTKNVSVGEKPLSYAEIIPESTKAEAKHCAVDTIEDMDIGGLRPRYLVGSSDLTREPTGNVRDITYWFQRFGRKLIGFIAVIAVFFIVWNAFGMVTSMGDADKISSSKKAIQWILIGLALAIFAYVIIKTVISLTYLSAV